MSAYAIVLKIVTIFRKVDNQRLHSNYLFSGNSFG